MKMEVMLLITYDIGNVTGGCVVFMMRQIIVDTVTTVRSVFDAAGQLRKHMLKFL